MEVFGYTTETFPYLQAVVFFELILLAWTLYLDVRQHRKLLEPRPKVIAEVGVSDEEYQKAQAYAYDKSVFAFVSTAIEKPIEYGMLLYYFGPWLWEKSGDIIGSDGLNESYWVEISHSLVFLLLELEIGTLMSIPFSLYSTFVLEQRHGFNKQTIGLFISDLIKGQLLKIIFGGLIYSALIWILKAGGDYFYLYAWGFVTCVLFAGMTIYPNYIQPLYNKVEPLPEGEVRTRIEELAAVVKYPLKKLYEVDGSKRSGHSNAYMYGFGKNKRIVLFDTLLKQNTTDETVAVLAHELGHWALSHTIKMLVVQEVVFFMVFFLFSRVGTSQVLAQSFGYSTTATIIGFSIFMKILSPVWAVLNLTMTLYIRKNEFEADQFAVNLGYAKHLRSGLIKLQVENKGNMNPDKWYSAYHYTHPPLIERLAAIDSAESIREAKGK